MSMEKNATKVIPLQVYQLSLSQAPRGFGAPYRGFPAFLAPSNVLKNHHATQANMLLIWVIRWPSLRSRWLDIG